MRGRDCKPGAFLPNTGFRFGKCQTWVSGWVRVCLAYQCQNKAWICQMSHCNRCCHIIMLSSVMCVIAIMFLLIVTQRWVCKLVPVLSHLTDQQYVRQTLVTLSGVGVPVWLHAKLLKMITVISMLTV